MIITELAPEKNRRVKVCLQGEAGFLLYRKEINEYDLKVGMDLTEELYETILEKTLKPRAIKRAMFLLEGRDHSEMQLREKLKKGLYPEEAIDAAIDYVTKFHYIDDQRMAENYIRFYQESRSRGRIRQDLYRKKISKEVIELALEEAYEKDETALIHELLRKKKYDPAHADQKEKARMFRFLAYRGFKPGDIMHALDTIDI